MGSEVSRSCCQALSQNNDLFTRNKDLGKFFTITITATTLLWDCYSTDVFCNGLKNIDVYFL